MLVGNQVKEVAKKQKKELYLPRLLAKIRHETGLTMMAVCSGGAGLHNVGQWSARFEELLARVPDKWRLIVAVLCGNDWYADQGVLPLSSAVKEAGAELCEAMKAKSEHQLAVVGMSARTWSYDKWMTESDQKQYDRNAAELVADFQSHGVRAVQGAGPGSLFENAGLGYTLL